VPEHCKPSDFGVGRLPSGVGFRRDPRAWILDGPSIDCLWISPEAVDGAVESDASFTADFQANGGMFNIEISS
jgi:hypothetical protein